MRVVRKPREANDFIQGDGSMPMQAYVSQQNDCFQSHRNAWHPICFRQRSMERWFLESASTSSATPMIRGGQEQHDREELSVSDTWT